MPGPPADVPRDVLDRETLAMEAWVNETLTWSVGLRLAVRQTNELASASRGLAAHFDDAGTGDPPDRSPAERAELGELLRVLAEQLDEQARLQDEHVEYVRSATAVLLEL